MQLIYYDFYIKWLKKMFKTLSPPLDEIMIKYYLKEKGQWTIAQGFVKKDGTKVCTNDYIYQLRKKAVWLLKKPYRVKEFTSKNPITEEAYLYLCDTLLDAYFREETRHTNATRKNEVIYKGVYK